MIIIENFSQKQVDKLLKLPARCYRHLLQYKIKSVLPRLLFLKLFFLKILVLNSLLA